MRRDSLTTINPVIGIIIVVKDGEKTLIRAIESVRTQKYTNWRLVIIDGNSLDGTKDIIHRYLPIVDYYESNSDSGIYDAMNKALRNINADWFIFLGCDDMLLDVLHSVAKKLLNKDTIYYGDVVCSSNQRIYDGKFNKYKLVFNNICHQSIFYPIEVSKYFYDTRYKFLADYELNLRLWKERYNFEYINLIVANYNDAGSATRGDQFFAQHKTELLANSLGLRFAIIWFIRNLLSGVYRRYIKGKYFTLR